ncbi:hypothetical protein Aduo_001542 [Ancylostoma duodenale]
MRLLANLAHVGELSNTILTANVDSGWNKTGQSKGGARHIEWGNLRQIDESRRRILARPADHKELYNWRTQDHLLPELSRSTNGENTGDEVNASLPYEWYKESINRAPRPLPSDAASATKPVPLMITHFPASRSATHVRAARRMIDSHSVRSSQIVAIAEIWANHCCRTETSAIF